jgi:hypothetical protein
LDRDAPFFIIEIALGLAIVRFRFVVIVEFAYLRGRDLFGGRISCLSEGDEAEASQYQKSGYNDRKRGRGWFIHYRDEQNMNTYSIVSGTTFLERHAAEDHDFI